MADRKVQEITIPIVFKTAANEYATITRNIQQALKNVDVNSAVGKRMQTALRNAQYKQLQLENLTSGEFMNIKDLNKVNSLTSQLETTLTKIQTDFASIDVTALALTPTELDSWKRAQKEVDKYVKAINDAKSGGATIGQLFSGDDKNKLNKAGIKDSATLTDAIGQAADKYNDLKAKAEEAADAVKKANAELAASQTKLSDLNSKSEKEVRTKAVNEILNSRADSATARIKMLSALSDTVKAKGAIGDKVSEVFNRTVAEAFQKNKEGEYTNRFKAGGADIVGYYLRMLGLDDAAISQIQTNTADRVKLIKEAIEKALRDNPIESYSAQAESALQKFWGKGKDPVSQLHKEQQAAQADVAAKAAVVASAQNAAGIASGDLKAQETVVQQLQATQANLQTKVDDLQAALNAAMQRVDELEQQLRGKYTPGGTDYGTQARGINTKVLSTAQAEKDRVAAEQAQKDAADLAQQETEQFQNRLQTSLKQWMGFSQIINIVRNGIRNAYQDIQNLDKAMTNIAVVTDMSVSDLWGKINEYMSIAQQYGVTTQGVYEVSQLFYQQGLGTADVMELTTETLKMARIAGMGYAEAADAMTVAIRGFKLEMSDAQHITDVYSEVAAISASDTQELATAMSKTASSAASVGMSFENTTAMIATMVEATRESATNIGSAMKSIISRMSEMKAGLSQDENGEFLDASKVETALKSVGVALRDSQGQFRDLDTVIIELGERWSSLDSATKRYLGTIIAGNRQQSRFLALMENYERFTEIQSAAMDAEDASVLQYAKTLDSLETKLNQISNSFQQFYMSILNGPVIGSFLSFLNSMITGFAKLGNFSSLFNIISIIKGVKTLASFLLTTFSKTGTDISIRLKQQFLETVSAAQQIGKQAGEAYGSSFASAARAAMGGRPSSGMLGLPGNSGDGNINNGNISNSKRSWGNLIASVAGGALSSLGAMASGNGDARFGSILSGAGTTVSMASTGFAISGVPGAVIGGVVGAVSQLPAIINSFKNALEESVANLKKETEEANIKRVENKQAASDLQSYIEKEEKLRLARNESAEAEQAYIDLQNEIAEKYPQYVSSIDESGNAIISMATATDDLTRALDLAAESTANWAKKALETARADFESKANKYDVEYKKDSNENISYGNLYNHLDPESVSWNILSQYFGKNISSENLPKIAKGTGYDERITKLYDFLGIKDIQEVVSLMRMLDSIELGEDNSLSEYGITEENASTISTALMTLLKDTLGEIITYENGIAEIDEQFSELQQLWQKIVDTSATSISTNTRVFSDIYNRKSDKTGNATLLKTLSGKDNIINQMINDSSDITAESYTQDQYDAIANAFANFYRNLGFVQQETLATYLEDWNAVSQTELDDLLKDADPEDAAVKGIQNYYASLRGPYTQRLTANMELFGEDFSTQLKNFIDSLSIDQVATFNSQLVSLYKQYEKGGSYAKEQIPKQVELLIRFYQNYSKIPEEIRSQFTTDFGSSDWAAKFSPEDIATLVKAGVLNSEEVIENYIYENLNTYLNKTSGRLTTLSNEFASAVDKQNGSGFSLSDAKGLIQKFNLDTDFEQLFNYDFIKGAYTLTAEGLKQLSGQLDKQRDALLQRQKELTAYQQLGLDYDEYATTGSSDIFSSLDKATEDELKSIYKEATKTGAFDEDIWQQGIQDLINAGQLALDDVGNTLSNIAFKGLQEETNQLQKLLKPSSLSDLNSAIYGQVDANGNTILNEEALKAAGLYYDKFTGDIVAGLQYYQSIIDDPSQSEDVKNQARGYLNEIKNGREELAKSLTGKITSSQIESLRQLDQDVSKLTIGGTWTSELIDGLTDATVKAIAKGSFAYSKASTAKSVASDMENLLTAMAEGSEVAVNDLVDIWETLTGNTATDDNRRVMEQAIAGGWQSVAAYLQSVIASSGYSEELAQAIRDIFDAIIDAMRAGAKTGISALKSGAEGTLSRADISDLATRSGLSDEVLLRGATPGLNGYQLNSDTLLRAAGGMAEQDPRYIQDIAKQLVDSGVIKSYDELQKKIKEVNKNTKENNKELEGQLKILEAMDNVWSNMSDNSDWFNQDVYGATDDKFQDYLDKTAKAADLMKNIQDGEQISWADSNWILELVSQSEVFQATMEKNSMTMDMFRDAIAAAVDVSTGNVDFGKALQSMNMSFAEFGEGFADSVSGFAKTRIAYLEGLLSLIETQEKFAEGLKNDTTINEAWNDLFRGVDGKGATENNIKNIRQSLQEIRDIYDKLVVEYFGEGHTFQGEFGYNPVDLILNTLGLTPEMLAAMGPELQGKMIGLFTSLNDFILNAFENTNWDDINDKGTWLQGLMNSVIDQAQAYAKEHDIPLDFKANTTIDAKTGQLVIEEPETETSEIDNLKTSTESVATALTAAETTVKTLSTTAQTEFGLIKTKVDELVASIETLQTALVGTNTTETPMDIEVKATITGYINATGVDPNKQVESLNATIGSFAPTAEGAVSKEQLVDGLVATVGKFLPAPGVDKNSLVSDLTALVNLSSNPEELYNNIVAYMSKKKVDVAVQLASNGDEEGLAAVWPNLTTVEQGLVQVITQGTAAETTVGNVVAKYGMLGAAAGDASTTIAETEKANQDNIKKTSDAAGVAKKKIADIARGEHKIKVNANTKPAIVAANQAVKDIESKSATVTVTYRSEMTETEKQNLRIMSGEGMPEPPKKGGLWNTVKSWFGGGKYQGTVNDLGPAYAQGTKTLVGELGPELAVYDNAYHLLGRNGAELVDIPDDAIIFNHKQTEGILKGQANNGRGKTVNGQPAFAAGNVSGPAYATGLSGAKQAIQNEIRMWQNFLDATMEDLLGSAGGGGGGGGSGNTLKAHIEDLVEWYNLTRQIADIEQKINNIIAKRANITDGRTYLKSLREQQHLLEGQALVQKTLLGYQQKQLELQAEQINTHDIWKQFFHVGNDGLLQYNMGNEVNGGKGTLTLLQQLNQMSGAEQLSYIKNLGYSYVTNDGEQLDGEDLISKFFEEAQAQIDKYDELRDTVESTDEALSKLESSINEIKQEIRDNQKELEEIIYNTLVEAWEKQISQLQEQTDMLREANEAYVNGLNDALNKERNQYSQNKSISDRQQLQRQLSLLRRSGGSASQIASLEEQLNSALKEEYFSHQQETIDSIKEANDKQLDALNKQITLQQETLDFQKENGVLWTKVYEVLSQSDGKIMEFLIQNSSEFIQASALAQADMLNEEWAKRIGIYKANSEEGFEPYVQKANQMFATEAWNSAEGPKKQSMFNALDVASQKALQDYFASAFANEMLRNGGDEAAAYEVARQDMYQKLYQAYNQMKNIQNTTLDAIRNISQPSVAPKDNAAGTGDGGGSNTGSGSKDNSGSSQKQWLRITYKGLVTTGNSKGKSNGGSPSGPSSLEVGKSGSISWNCYPGFVQGGFKVSDTSKCSVSGSSITALASGSVTVTLNYWDRTPTPAGASKATTTVKSSTNSSSSAAKIGGGSSGNSLLKKNLFANSLYAASGAFIESDDTPAILHKGEGVFTAGETSALRNMVKNYQTLAANLTGNSLLSAIGGIGSYSFSNTRNAGSELNINPGAVVIHVDKLDDKYDVDELATDVFNKLSTIASKATNRGVNRR